MAPAQPHADPRPTAGSAARRRCRRRAPGRGSRCATSPGASGSAGARTAARWCRSAPAAPGSPPAAGSLENRNAGSSGMRAAPPPAAAGARQLDLARSRRETTPASRWNTAGQQLQQLGRGRALAALDHAQVGHRRRALRRRAGCSAPTAPPASARCACGACAAWRRENGPCAAAPPYARPVPGRLSMLCEINSVKFPQSNSLPATGVCCAAMNAEPHGRAVFPRASGARVEILAPAGRARRGGADAARAAAAGEPAPALQSAAPGAARGARTRARRCSMTGRCRSFCPRPPQVRAADWRIAPVPADLPTGAWRSPVRSTAR